MAMFTSTESAVFPFMTPWHVTTTNGGVSANAYATDLSLNAVTIYKQDGTLFLSTTALDSLPTGVTMGGSFGILSPFSIIVDPSIFTTAGVLNAVLASNEIANMVPQLASAQWGGTVDLLATAATFINDNINATVGRIQQAVMGNTTWDHTTGTVGMFGGESFVLADEAGVPVSDQSLAVRRIDSTV